MHDKSIKSNVIELYGPRDDQIETQTRFNQEGKPEIPVPPEPPKAPDPRPTYSQDWPAYDAAKTNEDPLFKQLLVELVLITQEERTPRRGRIGHLTWEKVLSMCVKEYYKSDLRKTQGILASLHNAGLLPRVPGYRSIDRFYNDKAVTAVLERLLLISALPLASVEITGAMDSTGFAVQKYKCWNDYKWGKLGGKERIWVKLHAWVGTTTNVFVGAKVTPNNVGDATMFQTVVGNSTTYFKMQDFVADKAYNSREIFTYIHQLGLMPYIPFKENSSGKAKGSMTWSRMYREFLANNDEYMEHYHRRSNVESSFHMLKQRFGDHLLTKNFVANQNEILAKMLCHNICVLIQEAYERGIQIDFKAACDVIRVPVTNTTQ